MKTFQHRFRDAIDAAGTYYGDPQLEALYNEPMPIHDADAVTVHKGDRPMKNAIVAHVRSMTPGLGRIELQLPEGVPEWADVGRTVIVTTPSEINRLEERIEELENQLIELGERDE